MHESAFFFWDAVIEIRPGCAPVEGAASQNGTQSTCKKNPLRCSVPGHCAPQIFHQEIVTPLCFVWIEWGRRWWKFYVAMIYSFWIILILKLKNADFAKIWPLTTKLGQILTQDKKLTTNRECSSRAIRCFFLLSSTTLSFEKRGGGRISPSPCTSAFWNRPNTGDG